jgi:hypothetical protein
MAILKRIPNRTGDGAGRSRYALKKAVAVRTDIPSPLSLLVADSLSEELKTELASEFNRHLLLHQGSYKTQHFVISFGHHLSKEEIEKVLDRISSVFSDPERLHLFVVHQEEHGTAIHIVESADPEGKLRHLSRKEFFDLKKQVIQKLQPFLNNREKEIARNFARGIATQDWKHSVELKAPERSWKEYIRKAVEEVADLLKKGEIDQAVRLLKEKKVEIVEVKAGEKTPTGHIAKRDNVYAVFGTYSIRLNKKMKATFSRYKTAFERLRDETRRVRERIRRSWQELESYTAKEKRAGSIEKETGTTGLNPEEVARIREVRERAERVRAELERITAELSEELGVDRTDLERLARENERPAREEEPIIRIGRKPEERDRKKNQSVVPRAIGNIEEFLKRLDQLAERLAKPEDRDQRNANDRDNSKWEKGKANNITKSFETEAGIATKDRWRRNLDSERNQPQADMDRDRSQPTDKPDTADIPLWSQGTNRPDTKTGPTNAGTGPADTDASQSDIQLPLSSTQIECGFETGRLFVWVDQEKRMHISFWKLSENAEEIDLAADELDPYEYICQIAETWKENECRGNLVFELNGDAKYSERIAMKSIIEEIREHLPIFSYEKEVFAPYLKDSKKDIVEVAPRGIETNRFFLTKEGPIYEDEIRKEPQKFVDCEHEKVREIAENRIAEIEIAERKRKEREELERRRQKEEYRSRGPSRGR